MKADKLTKIYAEAKKPVRGTYIRSTKHRPPCFTHGDRNYLKSTDNGPEAKKIRSTRKYIKLCKKCGWQIYASKDD